MFRFIFFIILNSVIGIILYKFWDFCLIIFVGEIFRNEIVDLKDVFFLKIFENCYFGKSRISYFFSSNM